VSDKSMLSYNSIVVRCGSVVEAQIDGEIVAMNVESGNCYGLNSIGTRIWSFLAEPVCVSSIFEQLEAEYDVEPETCKREVLTLLNELHAEKLISTVPDK